MRSKNKDVFHEASLTLKEHFILINNFARCNNAIVKYSTTHDYPALIISFKRELNQEDGYFINKNIYFMLDSFKKPLVYKIWVGISNSYGLKEFFAFLPFLSNKRDTWKRIRRVKDISLLETPINKDKLLDSLKEATETLKSSGEFWGQEAPQAPQAPDAFHPNR